MAPRAQLPWRVPEGTSDAVVRLAARLTLLHGRSVSHGEAIAWALDAAADKVAELERTKKHEGSA